ncbi:TraR/DksA family transcriptional regulator [Ursidibacter sp. B-7004-1]
MQDQIDKANELAEKEREFALAKLRNKPTACSLTHCQDCNEVIPEARRKHAMGCTRCIDCQQIYEHKAKGYRK